MDESKETFASEACSLKSQQATIQSGDARQKELPMPCHAEAGMFMASGVHAAPSIWFMIVCCDLSSFKALLSLQSRGSLSSFSSRRLHEHRAVTAQA
jgi:hypothetical protein